MIKDTDRGKDLLGKAGSFRKYHFIKQSVRYDEDMSHILHHTGKISRLGRVHESLLKGILFRLYPC